MPRSPTRINTYFGPSRRPLSAPPATAKAFAIHRQQPAAKRRGASANSLTRSDATSIPDVSTQRLIPPDHNSRTRQQINEWADLWNGHPSRVAPAYTASWGHILAGLLQAEPPAYTTPEPAGGWATPESMLAELTEQAVPHSAGFGSVFLRPIPTQAGVWELTTLKPTNVTPIWDHHRLHSATVWDIAYDPRDQRQGSMARLVIIETWNTDGRVIVELFEADTIGGHCRLGNRIGATNTLDSTDLEPPAALEGHPYHTAIGGHDPQPRTLTPFVWKWEDGHPAPVFVRNEPAIRGLQRLSTQEQEDAEMARNRIAIAADSLLKDDVWSSDGARKIAQSGFNTDSNVLALARGMSAQNPGEGGVQVITFPDGLTQRDRIERRQNEILEAIGINPQSIGRSVTGRSDSAAAKRADQQMTMNTIAGPARRWQQALQTAVAQLHTLNRSSGQAPTVRIVEGMKLGTAERIETVQIATAADAMSTRTKLETIHPEWSDIRIDRELADLAAEGIIAHPDQPQPLTES
jgi:hypothetical protein